MLKSEIVKFNPDLIHAHYASSYGFIAFLTRFKPFILSAWGSDIYDFPNRNFINHSLTKKVLGSATIVCSTSYAMKNIIEKDFKLKMLLLFLLVLILILLYLKKILMIILL